ncbi:MULTISPECIES: 16S rRNA (guanine(966)-N(2))-methyltransferase RsmD [unclassified Nocardioides]|uniref:16S rRNA (guanine(966)-N(2))-methyltransferase RsmD n=1 Tax=unclassified Nocardioides TaxID=2615069 RepID=UPI0006F4F080|nr:MULTISPECIES: 16S rRNA (guanine(966)-N(2))-methyltransferase RsmD [unclassified Nocardioides]KRA29597.1 16S rRNA (guanine(966)-N(2))-methyltransferase RsmD [Nocardioides sp. Root614]KRA88228.1 16S rRNA (guanine(966)-N(2))-methyltransferase RsmD [Nocardioides sp. Root682]
MTRIIAGAAGGRRLQTPKGDQTRPTSDRVREALFSSFEAWAGSLQGLRVLDLYAGSGAIGLEAWSRGAAAVTLVESDRSTADLIRGNARSVGCEVAEVISRSVTAVLTEPAPAPFDLVFSDPPYPLDDDTVADDLALLAAQGWLADDALVVVERSRRSPQPTWPSGVVPLSGKRGQKRYGETTVWFAEHPAPTSLAP